MLSASHTGFLENFHAAINIIVDTYFVLCEIITLRHFFTDSSEDMLSFAVVTASLLLFSNQKLKEKC